MKWYECMYMIYILHIYNIYNMKLHFYKRIFWCICPRRDIFRCMSLSCIRDIDPKISLDYEKINNLFKKIRILQLLIWFILFWDKKNFNIQWWELILCFQKYFVLSKDVIIYFWKISYYHYCIMKIWIQLFEVLFKKQYKTFPMEKNRKTSLTSDLVLKWDVLFQYHHI